MNKVLTSLISLCVVGTAWAVPTHVSDTFPENGSMQEDYIYTNAATKEHMGVTSGVVYAEAYYTLSTYTIPAGYYLEKDTEGKTPSDFTKCLANNFCLGGEVEFSETEDQGLTACSTLDGGYNNSDAGAASANRCYKECTDASTVAHALTVSGRDYYADGVDECYPTACQEGYHVFGGTGTPLALDSIVGDNAGMYYAIINHSGSFKEWNAENSRSYQGQAHYTIGGKDSFAVDYSGSVLTGHGRCSTSVENANPWNGDTYTVTDGNIVKNLTNETGQTGAQYCYCQLDGYTSAPENTQSLSSPWIFINDFGDADSCADDCTMFCANLLRKTEERNISFRNAVFANVKAAGGPGSECAPNTIAIVWGSTDQPDIDTNEAGTCTYGGDIYTPVKAKERRGYSFKGWIFSTTPNVSQTQVNNPQ